MDLSQSVAMEHFTVQDRIFCVEAYLEFGRSVTRARRAFQKFVKSRRNQKIPSETAIKRWVQSFRTTGAIDQRTKQPGERRSRTPETIAEVSRIIEENPQQIHPSDQCHRWSQLLDYTDNHEEGSEVAAIQTPTSPAAKARRSRETTRVRQPDAEPVPDF